MVDTIILLELDYPISAANVGAGAEVFEGHGLFPFEIPAAKAAGNVLL